MPKSNPELAAEMGKRLCERRKQLGMTQEKVAEGVGIAYQQYNKVEKGKSCLGSDSLKRVSKVLNISADYLLTGESDNTRYQDVLSLMAQMTDRQIELVEQVLRCMLKFSVEGNKNT